MTTNIERLAKLITLCFVVVSLGLGYWQVVRASELVGDPSLNRARLYEEEKRIQRGRILDRNGEVLVRTEMTAEGGKRVYSAPWLVHVTGHYSLRYGNTSVERSFDQYLRGKAGVDAATVFKDRLLRRPIVGNDVVLTIDSRLQRVAEQELGESRGAIVAMNPRTGEILALASHPYYDPNDLERDWPRLRDDPTTPLVNRATQGLYAPGSTFKTLTLAVALDTGQARLDEKFDYVLRPGNPPSHSEIFHGFSVYCANHQKAPPGNLSINLAEAYAASCNVTFARLGVRLGHQRLADYAGRFGFGQELPVEIASAPSQLSGTPGFLRDDAALASTAFGQGQLLVSPLQMTLITNAVANGGAIVQPHVVKEVRSDRGVVWKSQTQLWRKPIQSATADMVRSTMIESVERGWAVGASIAGVKVAGKTGTAETGPGKPTHAWFTAFAPADNPIIAVTVVKEHAGFGSAEAIPPAKKVLEAALALAR